MKKLLYLSIGFLIVSGNLISQPTPPSGKQWEKIENMSDEFNGSSLDLSKWHINFQHWEGRKPARFEASAVSVAGGNLRITGSKKSNPYDGWTHNGGFVGSQYNVKYGYFETRMKANKTFLSSTFWLINNRVELSGCDRRVTELDITETVGIVTGSAGWLQGFDQRMNSNTHSRDVYCGEPTGSNGNQANLGGYSWADYHTYGVWWKSATELILYLDGQNVGSVTPPADFDIDMYLRMVVESYDWNPVQDGSDGMNDTWNNRTTFYDWTRSWRLVDETGGGNNTVSCASLPSSVASSTTINVSVPYEASQNRDVVVEFWDSGWLGQGSTSVSSGSGTAQVAIPLSSAPPEGSNYLFKTSIRPTGGDWTTNIDACQKTNVTVTTGSPGQTPYGGSNRSIPGTIEAEHYDVGGEGVAYHDTSSGNAGGLVRSDDVDIEARDGGHNVGWTADGEWLEYTVDATSGTYDLEARVAATSIGKNLVVKLDGTTLGTVNVPNTGGWGTFQTVTLNGVSVSGGNDKVLRIEFDGGSVNLNWVKLSTVSGPESVDCSSLPTSITSQTSYTVSVPYVANQSRDVVVEFWDSGWIAEGTTTVGSGSGNASVTVNLPSAPTAGSNYQWKSSIRPVGTDWTQNIDACNQNNVTVTSAGCDVPYSAADINITNQTVNWSSGSIDISCVSSVDISMVAAGVGPMENADYLNIYYKLNGGSQVAILENTNTYSSNTLTVNGLSGNTLELIVNGYTSFSDETYTVDDISVVSSSGSQQSSSGGQQPAAFSTTIMYPNPLQNGDLTIISRAQGIGADVKVYDVKGQLIMKYENVRDRLTIPRQNFAAKGMYFVHFQSGLMNKQMKLIIQ